MCTDRPVATWFRPRCRPFDRRVGQAAGTIPFIVAVLLLGLLLCAGNALAQSSAGTIQGTVRDSSGAVVPGADVHITATSTGVSLDVTANSAGFYIAPSLVAGAYRLETQVAGFAKWEANMVLRAAQTAEVDITLAVGMSADAITVKSDMTQLVTTDSGTISNTLEQKRIEQLPLNGRDLSTLIAMTTPGVYFDGSGVRVDGLNWDAFEFVQDGAVTADRDGGGVLQQRLPGLDSIGEVHIETNSSSAKFNRPGTGIISTKSGTNQIHGTLFETNRDNGYGLARARQDNYVKAPQLIRNEFGGSVGGPIYLPRIYNGKNRSFFFVNWEGLELRQGVSKTFTVPTPAMRQGDFSGLVNSLGQTATIYDPLSTGVNSQRTPFVGNQIPVGRMSPLAKTLWAATPLPTNGVNPLVGSNWIGVVPNNETDKTLTTRLDENISEKDRIYFRFSRGSRMQNFMGGNNWGPYTIGDLNMDANVTYRPIYNDGGAFSWTHIVSPTFFMETVLSTNYEGSAYYTGPNPNELYATKLGLPNNLGRVGFPNITGTGLTQYGQNDNTRRSSQFISVIDQNITWIRGRHQIEFGGRYRHERLHILPDQGAGTTVNFTNQATANLDLASGAAYNALNLTGFNGADFFLGYAAGLSVNQNMSWFRFRDQEISTYIQDSFKLSPRLTLNYGIRWEIHPGIHERDGAFATFDLKNKAIVLPGGLESLQKLGYTSPAIVALYTNIGAKFETPSQAGWPNGIWQTYWKSVLPRVSVAYKAFGNEHPTMIRAGYSMFNYPPPLRNFYTVDPPFTASYTKDFTNSGYSPDGLPNWLLRNVPTVIAGQNTANLIDTNSPNPVCVGCFGVSGNSPDYPPSFVHQWNFTIERELAYHTVVSVTYTGTHATNLEQYWAYNDAPPDYVWYTVTGQPKPTGTYSRVLNRPFSDQPYGSVQQQLKTGWMNNNSFKFQVQRPFQNGYSYQFFYTLSNDFRCGGNGFRDGTFYNLSTFLPGTVATDQDQRLRDLCYQRDTAVPKHSVQANWLVDLPFGKGKALLKNAGRLTNTILGGWQFSGTFNLWGQWWQPTLSDYMLSDIQVYGTKYKINDCRSNQCQAGYLYFNGYISPNLINTDKGVTGIPSGYTPSHQPINPYNCPTPNLCNTNTVPITLANGQTVTTTYQTGPSNLGNPWHKVFFPGPINYVVNGSLVKNFAIRERANLQFHADAFNLLNMPGMGNPNSTTGIISLQTSYNSPRVLQLALRLAW